MSAGCSEVLVTEVPNDLSAAQRARWLAELSEALDEADQLASRLGLMQQHSAEALELLMRLGAARAEVQALQLGKRPDQYEDFSPEWSDPPLWPDKSGEPR